MQAARSIPDLLRARAKEEALHRPVVVDGGSHLTYAVWLARSRALALGLGALGVVPGDRVALFFDNRWWTDYAVAYIGVLSAGAVAVPLSPRFSAPELERVLAHAAAEVVICPPELAGTVAGSGRRVLHGDDLEQAGRAAVVNPPGGDGLAEIVYTSGTAGAPKGVACTHDNLLEHDLPEGEGAGSRAGVFLHAFPIGTNAGQECVRMPLRRRATAIVLPTFDPERLCAAVAQHSVRALQLVPAMARMLVESGAVTSHDLSSVERIVLSSAPAPPALWERLGKAFPNAVLFNAYALTESGPARTLMRYDPGRPECVGRPVGRTEVRISSDEGTALGPGEVGEIWLRRPGAPPRSYFGDPEATAATFVDGWVRTGDLGYLDDDGLLYLVDRKKDLVISGGMNISSLEVEAALAEHVAVADVAVLGIPHEVLGQSVAAAVVAREEVGERDLQAFVRERLGEHKVPRRIVFVESLPRNASGKVLKRDLGALLAPERREHSATSSTAEAEVARVWEEVLGRSGVGRDDDFFDLGGHSLAATQIAARLAEAFSIELDPTVVFEHPTVAELARVVAGASGTAR